MKQPTKRDKPTWEILDPDENELVVCEWVSIEGKVHGFPLGQFDEVEEKLAAYLARHK